MSTVKQDEREWALIRRAARIDETLSDYLKARDLLFDAGLGKATDAITTAARRYFRANKREFPRTFAEQNLPT